MIAKLTHHKTNDLGLGSVRLFQIGLRDGLDEAEGEVVAITGRAFAAGVALGHQVRRHTTRLAA